MPRPRSSTPPPPLDAVALDGLALAYVGRYATSRARLAQYLARKLRERGWDDAAAPDPHAIAARMAALGYVDDRGLAEARGRALGRAGYGARRVAAALDALGIARADAAGPVEDAVADGFARALRFAERRRIGPFAAAPPDDRARRRALAALLRAGHGFADARRIVTAEPGERLIPDE